jgi:hypothetical protein
MTREAVALPVGQILACRLRHAEVVGKRGPLPNMGEAELENLSSAPIDIPYRTSPLQHLDVVVTGPGGEVVSVEVFGNRFSPTAETRVLRLFPHQPFTVQIPLLSTVPTENRVPGTYKVQAVYEVAGCRVTSEPIAVTVPDTRPPQGG